VLVPGPVSGLAAADAAYEFSTKSEGAGGTVVLTSMNNAPSPKYFGIEMWGLVAVGG
jgi:hypothetical protein